MGMKLFYPRDANWDIDEINEILLAPNQVNIIEYLKENGPSSRKELVIALQINTNTIKYALRRLIEWKLITRIGRRKSTKYEVIEKNIPDE